MYAILGNVSTTRSKVSNTYNQAHVKGITLIA